MDTNFFTLAQAQEHAAATHRQCRELAKRTKHELIFSHTTLLSLRGVTLNLDTTLAANLLHVTVDCMEKKSRLIGAQ